MPLCIKGVDLIKQLFCFKKLVNKHWIALFFAPSLNNAKVTSLLTLKDKEVPLMYHPEEPYYGVYYSDNPYNQKVEFSALLNGNAQPIIAEIAKENYNNLLIDLSGSNLSHKVNQVANVLNQLPSITHFHISGPIDSVTAANLVKPMLTTNIIEFKVTSFHLDANSMPSLIKALHDSQIPRLDINGSLDSDAIASLKLKDTALQELTIYNHATTGEDYLALFNNANGSSITALSLDSDLPCAISSEITKQIDFSQTSISIFDWSNVNFEPDALRHLNFAHSPIVDLHIYSPEISGADLEALSENLLNSNVKILSLFAGEEISHLHLENTPVETLNIGIEGSDLVHLHLQGSNVKTLDLSSNGITDQDLTNLHLKNTHVQHLILDQNDITEAGMAIIRDLIKDTSVIDVSINTQHFNFVDGAPQLDYKDCLIVNNHVLPIQKSSAIHLSDVLSESEHFFESSEPAQSTHSLPWLQPTLQVDQMIVTEVL